MSAFQASETMLWRIAKAVQEEIFLQVLNQAMLFKHKYSKQKGVRKEVINEAVGSPENMQVSVSC